MTHTEASEYTLLCFSVLLVLIKEITITVKLECNVCGAI